jgi:hypothetical protein
LLPLKRHAAIEPVIEHLKVEHWMACRHLAQRTGDATNADSL